MKKEIELKSMSPKRLRTLRNNLNNRLSSFKVDGEKAKPLQPSHTLYGRSEAECQNLLDKLSLDLKNKLKTVV